MSYSKKRMQSAFNNALHIHFNEQKGFVIMSDAHRGCGTWSDNFLPNRHIFTAALKFYQQKEFSYIELGDGEELWECRKFSDIYRINREIYDIYSQFAEKNRLFLVYGNHDRIMKKDGRHESIVIDTPSGPLYLFHGFQGDLLNDSLWMLSRWLVRYIWRPLELCGFRDPTSPALNVTKLRKTEKKYADFSCQNQCVLICGHTHRPTIMKLDCGIYLNCGSAVHPGAVTALEIVKTQRETVKASLNKWSVCAGQDMKLYVCKEILDEIEL